MSLNSVLIPRNCTVGIITLVGNFNYGNRLQAYASYIIYEKRGMKPVHLRLCKRFILVDELKLIVKKVLGKHVDDPEKLMTSDRRDAFSRFNSRMESKLVSSTRDDFLNKLAYVSIGSDQVWNPTLIKHYEDWYLAEFASAAQRIALSPSIGLDNLELEFEKRFAASLTSFPHVSIREKRGAELIKECAGIDAEVICDPTLVLPAEEWRAVADGRCTPEEPYVFTYLLGGVGAEAADVLDRVTEHGRIPVIPLSDRQKPGEPDAGPAEFIDLIDHAAHVVTDSFHAAVFSSILQTPLTIVHREGGASMFSRLEQLSEMLGIEEKVYRSPTYDLVLAGEYDGVPEAIEREREKFMTYLEGCLDG